MSIAEYVQQLGETAVQAAGELGANAVVTVRFTTSMLMGGAAEILVVGTAVVVE